jgi:hypothetical protein
VASDPSWFAELVRETVIVNTRAGTSFKGIVAAVYADAVVLRDVVDLNDPAGAVVAGPLGIPRINVDCVQQIVQVSE